MQVIDYLLWVLLSGHRPDLVHVNRLAGQHPAKDLPHGGAIIGVDQVQTASLVPFHSPRVSHAWRTSRRPATQSAAVRARAGDPDVRKRLRLAEQGRTTDKGRYDFNALGNISRVDDDTTN